MKAISIGYSTEDGTLFFDQYDDMVEGLKKAGYYNAFVDQHGVEDGLEDQAAVQQHLDKMLAEDMERFGTGDDKAEWDQNVTKFLEAIQGQSGTFVSWSVEYDDNLMFVFDTTVEEIEALEQSDDEQDEG